MSYNKFFQISSSWDCVNRNSTNKRKRNNDNCPCILIWELLMIFRKTRSGHRATATPKMKFFMTIVDVWNQFFCYFSLSVVLIYNVNVPYVEKRPIRSRNVQYVRETSHTFEKRPIRSSVNISILLKSQSERKEWEAMQEENKLLTARSLIHFTTTSYTVIIT